MKRMFQDGSHLFRVAGLFVLSVAVFLVIRNFVIPSDFGLYGHYRAGALDDNRARALSYAGSRICEECHTDIVETRRGSRHAAISCETCHGALAAHADDPTILEPELPAATELCLVCHTENVGKPKGFPAIEPDDHAGDVACSECHDVHHPDLDQE